MLGATYDWPQGLLRAVPVVLGMGFFATLVVAWYHGEKGAQRVSGPELTILAVLFGLAGLGVMLVGGRPGTETGAEGNAEAVGPEPSEAVLDQTAIAVLPFETIGGGEDFFAAGLTDELQQTLSRVPTLRVTARTSASVFRQASVSADSIGRALRVAHLVEGTVRMVGEGRVRIAARLVDAESGLQEWSETYDRDVADVFAIQEEIARAVAFALRVQVGSAVMVSQSTLDPEVFELVVRARQVEMRGGDYAVIIPEANRLYEEALARDSTYAPAWVGLARIHSKRVTGDWVTDKDAERAAMRAAAERALSLDPTQGEAHILLSTLARRVGDYERAKAHLEQAIASNPADALALARLAIVYLYMGDEAAALRSAERAAALDPLYPSTLYSAAYTYSATGHHDTAIELGRAMLALTPDDAGSLTGLANFLAAAGQGEEATPLARRAIEMGPQWQHPRDVLAIAYAQAGDRAEAERVLDGLTNPRHAIRAGIEAGLGDWDAAFAALERAIAADEIPTIGFWLSTTTLGGRRSSGSAEGPRPGPKVSSPDGLPGPAQPCF